MEYKDQIKVFCDDLISRGLTNSDIAIRIIKKFRINNTQEVVRHFVKRRRYKFTEDNNQNILVIGDIHLPFEHKGYLDFCIKQRDLYNCKKIIFAGDIFDGHAISFYSTNPNGLSAKDELELARNNVKPWYSAFPNAVILNGNHDILSYRKSKAYGIPMDYMKSLQEVYGTPGWEFKDEYITQGILFIHGDSVGASAAYDKALYKGMSVVQGHVHSELSIRYINENIFGMMVSCGVDQTAYAFEYANGFKKPFIKGCGVIIGGIPMIIPMK